MESKVIRALKGLLVPKATRARRVLRARKEAKVPRVRKVLLASKVRQASGSIAT